MIKKKINLLIKQFKINKIDGNIVPKNDELKSFFKKKQKLVFEYLFLKKLISDSKKKRFLKKKLKNSTYDLIKSFKLM